MSEGVEKLEKGLPFLISLCYILSFKKNGEKSWKPHQAEKIFNALLIPRNTLMASIKQKPIKKWIYNIEPIILKSSQDL